MRFREFKFALPGSGVRALTIDAQVIKDPNATLERLLNEARTQADLNEADQVRQFAVVSLRSMGWTFQSKKQRFPRS